MKAFRSCIGALLIVLTFATAGLAQKRTVSNLPYRFPQTDTYGNVWMLYHGGRLMQQGNMPFCSDSASLTINGQGVSSNTQSVNIDANGEAILEGLRTNQFTLTRRFFQGDDGVMRIVDLIRNTKNQDVTANVTINFNVNFGVQSSRPLTDPRKTDRTLANVVTDSQGRSSLSVYAGRGSKFTPTINAQPNNNSQIQTVYELKIPANKEVALVTFHQTGVSPDQADKLFASLREPRALSSLPQDIRKLVINYPTSTGAFDDLELLRGTTSDIVELTNGDQLKGDVLASNWEIETSFGKVQIPHDQVIALLVTAGLRPRQLIVTSDGEIIGGKLANSAIDMRLSSGQPISLPVTQVSRLGRRAATESTSTSTRPAKPMLHLRSGDRLAVVMPAEAIRIATRFGTLALSPQSICSLDLQPEQTPVHMIALADGSRFSGILLGDTLDLTLARGGKITIPSAMVRKLSFAAASEEDTDPPAALRLLGEDVLTVSLPGKLTLVTVYGEVPINGPEIKRIGRVKETVEDVQVTLWDDSVISGRLSEASLECTLAGGTLAKVPVGAVEQYTCAAPQPSAAMVDRIRKLIADLNADDWKQRERSEAELLAMGPNIISNLKQLRSGQPPEAQQRIDSILKQLDKAANKPAAVPVQPAIPMFR